MFVNKSSENDRGQVGIGTLIVFIAMVLVAAIAAGVLINTAGMLQSQAEATGEESTDLVSERIDVTTTVGDVDDADDGTLESIRIGVSGAPGADDIDLSETIVQVVGPEGHDNLEMADADDSGGDIDEDAAAEDLDDEFFGVVNTDGEYQSTSDAVIDSENGEYSIVLNPADNPLGSSGADAFGEGQQATLDIVSPSGATTQVELRAPDLFNSDDESVRL
ncbi:archaellin/type IV pilin N-terminal domain-containing protein [Natrialba sp. SSL1]|uniref:archaellin/type IV pilin N-terminal domain-containing protein n=1 Tax=Natrialba sp. SSL1 TaxID=1869245 RepID=UPI0009FBB0C4|nr:archaellin/type IV pilin N-terminal domain-containing protein [Natrialba sp. SSL1]